MLEALRDFVERVTQANISYMVTGSFAMSAYTEPRMTRDIDIVIEIKREDVDAFVKLFEEDHYVDKTSIRRAIDYQSVFNLIHLTNMVKIDCIVLKNKDFEKEKFARRRQAKIDDLAFWTITKEDLILSKLNWAKDTCSEMQIKDIDNLISGDYDSEYVQGWISQLGLEEMWQKVLTWKTQHQK